MRSSVLLVLAACGRLDFAPVLADGPREDVGDALLAPRLVTGTYLGNATDNRHIDVAFAPAVVLLKRNTDNFWGRLRTSSMPGTKLLDGAVTAGAIRALDASGFSVSGDPDVNATGIAYHWIAFAASPDLAVGSYTGNGVDNRTITVGWSPALVITADGDIGLPLLRSSTMPPDSCHDVDATERANAIQAMVPTGFQLGSDILANGNGKLYYYVAFAPVSGKLATGTYTGDGSTAHPIDVGFAPEWLLVKRVGGGVLRPWVHRPAAASGNLSLFLADFGGIADAIQTFRPTGFQVGNQPQVNETGLAYHWIAFGN